MRGRISPLKLARSHCLPSPTAAHAQCSASCPPHAGSRLESSCPFLFSSFSLCLSDSLTFSLSPFLPSSLSFSLFGGGVLCDFPTPSPQEVLPKPWASLGGIFLNLGGFWGVPVTCPLFPSQGCSRSCDPSLVLVKGQAPPADTLRAAQSHRQPADSSV